MKEVTIKIKPMSVNVAWRGGRRFISNQYKIYTKAVLALLPPLKIPSNKMMLVLDVGFSSKSADLDNCIKPILDLLQKKYLFNDKQVYRIDACKEIVKKGEEYFTFQLFDYPC